MVDLDRIFRAFEVTFCDTQHQITTPSMRGTYNQLSVQYKYTVMSRDQNAGRGHNIKTDNTSFERVEEFGYLVTILTNQNSIQ